MEVTDPVWKSLLNSSIVRKEIEVRVLSARYDDARGTLIIKTPWLYKENKPVHIFVNDISEERVFCDFGCKINQRGFLDLDDNKEYFVHLLVYKKQSNRWDYPFTLSTKYNQAGLFVRTFNKGNLLRKEGTNEIQTNTMNF
ncbi:MAG: hypothetical protein ACP5TL_00005 [Candidatus Micrarchaeia archaeon]